MTAHTRTRSAFILLTAATSAALIGCSSGSPPTIEVTRATLVEQTTDGALINLTLRAENPNNRTIPLREVRYTVSAAPSDGPTTALFSGIRSAEATVRQYGTQTFTLPAAMPSDLLPSAGTPIRISGEITYYAPGTLASTLFELNVVRPTTAFAGQADLQPQVVTVPAAAPQSPSTEPAPNADPAK